MTVEFDGIAEVYDSTREAATEAELGAVTAALDGAREVLDVGCGTGRFGVPLSKRGFDVVGVDISRKMMERAREKGMRDLILADATRLPFRDGVFEAATIFHVLHIVPDWRSLMRSVARVTDGRIVSLLRQRSWGADDSGSITGGVGRRYVQLRREMGYPVDRPQRSWRNEQEIREAVPPIRSVNVRDEVVTTTIGEAIDRFIGMRVSIFRDVPGEVQDEIRRRMIEEAGATKIERRMVEDVVTWNARQFDDL